MSSAIRRCTTCSQETRRDESDHRGRRRRHFGPSLADRLLHSRRGDDGARPYQRRGSARCCLQFPTCRPGARMTYAFKAVATSVGLLKLVASDAALMAVLWENDDPK